MDERHKIIRDPVHGYIIIPDDLCQRFVDTPIFQRLRSIEQTSMRCLFPGGRHDRFIHSLGVYHLAKRLYEGLLRNIRDNQLQEIIGDPHLRKTFEVAALMHDCGHAPFSHTTEFLYNKYGISNKAHDGTYIALQGVVDESARAEFNFSGIKGKKPADHEAMSAYVLVSCFKEDLAQLDIDATLAARMITGVVHLRPTELRDRVENILIRLINGDAIDVDKLDYIVRDTWASGVKNASIDIGRLLDAAIIKMDGDEPKFSYLSSALSVIQTVIDARNYLYEWIYGHHTVIYYAELLKRLCLELGKVLEQDGCSADEILAKIFSPHAFIGDGVIHLATGTLFINLLNDGDVMAYLKRYLGNHPFYRAIEAHRPVHFALWKTEAEFKTFIQADKQSAFDAERCAELFRTENGWSEEDCFTSTGMSSKLYDVEPKAVKILMPNGVVKAFTEVANAPTHPSISSKRNKPFGYIYISKRFQTMCSQLLDSINAYEW
ncbi:MAG: HD domain-containing protein [Kiritimatiellae bacterium]|nr:HD domain-containing protein [Kiritimatiellia bacterium]MBQ6339137.1 HD domain-containing protein [Kiritimatiellia bacterium]